MRSVVLIGASYLRRGPIEHHIASGSWRLISLLSALPRRRGLPDSLSSRVRRAVFTGSARGDGDSRASRSVATPLRLRHRNATLPSSSDSIVSN